MAHASSLEKCQLTLKKARQAKKKKREEWNKLDEEKKAEIVALRNAPVPIKRELQTMLWDYEHRQLHTGKLKHFLELIDQRLIELNNLSPEFFKGEKEKYEKIRGEKNVRRL